MLMHKDDDLNGVAGLLCSCMHCKVILLVHEAMELIDPGKPCEEAALSACSLKRNARLTRGMAACA